MDVIKGENNYDQALLQSKDPSLRKLARQQRLKRRIEAGNRLKTLLETPSDKLGVKSHLLQTIDNSNQTIFQVFVEGKEMVSNIRISAGTREIQRREEELVARNSRLQKLEEESSIASEKLQLISNKWEEIFKLNDPLDLFHELKGQQERCAELVEQKDALINDLQRELTLADERFMSDRSDMLEDISIMAERINEQVLVMKSSYDTELKEIESAIAFTRNEIVDQQEGEWKTLYEKREQEEITYMTKILDMIENNEEEITKVHTIHDEKYRQTKIRLDIDVQVLEQELENIKALCLVNSEKLDYNYQVLKKRQDENVIIKNNQKKALNKLQEEVFELRKQNLERESATKGELNKLKKEVCRFHKNILEIEKKADNFSEVNDRKFQQIWNLKSNDATQLLNKILAANQFIHEHILVIKLEPSVKKPLKKEDLVSYQAAVALINEVFMPIGSSSQVQDTQTLDKVDRESPILKRILTLIAENSGFLLEEKLNELLGPYSDDERTLVRLDHVFNALGITKKHEVELILDYFLPFATCSTCSTPMAGDVEKKCNVVTRCNQYDECHTLEIKKTELLKALRKFVLQIHASKLTERSSADVYLAKDRCTVSRIVTREDVEAYWASFLQVFTSEEEDLWNIIHAELIKYHSILQERERLNKKAYNLKKQNMELRRLLDMSSNGGETGC